MSDIIIEQFDSAYIQIKCDRALTKELSQHFTFFVPNYQYTPAYKNKIWDGQIRLFNVHTGKIYAGLTDYVLQFAKDRNYTVEFQSTEIERTSPEEVYSFLKTLNLSIGDKEIMPHEHQFDAIHHAINKRRCLLLSPTGSGKSLIIYVLIRYYLSKLPENKKVLIIVPTTGLVTQMLSDFEDYSNLSSWNAKRNCHSVYSGQAKKSTKRITISTWQSIYKLPQSDFEEFGAVIGDECHLFKAKSLTGLLTKLTNAEYRVGTTGTLDGTQTHRLVLEGLFGSVNKVTTTKELMDKKTIATLDIKCVVLKHSDEDCKLVKNFTYAEEMDFLVGLYKRNRFIVRLCNTLKGNTLCLFKLVEKHGVVLHSLMKDFDRKVFFVYGGTDTDTREKIRAITEKETNAIIVASYGTFSTGINIRNLHNVVFSSPSKSRIRVLQSIGRGLRTSKDNSTTRLYDIADDLTHNGRPNYTLSHFQDRINIYNEEQFNYEIDRVKI